MSESSPPPEEEGDFKKFEELAKQVLSVPKSEIEKREANWREARSRLQEGK